MLSKTSSRDFRWGHLLLPMLTQLSDELQSGSGQNPSFHYLTVKVLNSCLYPCQVQQWTLAKDYHLQIPNTSLLTNFVIYSSIWGNQTSQVPYRHLYGDLAPC